MLQQIQEIPVATKSKRITRRNLLRGLLGVGVADGGRLYAQVEPFWIDQHEIARSVANLPKAF